MAIDPTIALGVRPVESPLDSMGKALSIQNMQNQGTMSQLGIQQAQTQMAQQRALNQAYADPANRNPDGSINYAGVQQSLAEAGAGSQIPGTVKAGMEAQTAQMNLTESHMKLMAQHNTNMQDRMSGLISDKAISPDKIKSAMDDALQAGDLDQQHYQQALQTMPQTADPNALKAWLAQQATQVYATGQKLQAFLPKPKLETVGGQLVPTTTTEATGEMTAGAPLMSTPLSEAAKTWHDTHPGQPMTPEFAAAADRKATYIAPSMVTMMMQGGGGANFDASKPLSPVDEAIANSRAQGNRDTLTSSRGNPHGNEQEARAQFLYQQEHPGESIPAGYFASQKTGETSFTPGRPNGQTLIALNTAVDHIQLLRKAAAALNNGDVQSANALGNYLGIQFGSNQATNYNTIADTLASEVAKVNGAGVVTESGKHEARANFPTNGSNAQIGGAIDTSIGLMGGKLNALNLAYSNATRGRTLAADKKLTPAALAAFQGVLQQHEPSAAASGGQPSTGEPTAVGPGGHTIVYRNGAWMDPQTGKVVQ